MTRAVMPCPETRPIVVTLGDPAGVGPECVGKAWAARADHALPPFFAVGDARSVAAVWDGPVEVVDSAAGALAAFSRALPVWHLEDRGEITPGTPNLDGAQCALQSLEVGIGLARQDCAGALVTGPVSKHQLHLVGYTHPGQTEFIAERCGVAAQNAVMMLAAPDLRVVPLTIHIPLADVPQALTSELIVSRARVLARSLSRDFGITAPRLALAGLNPHAGENGDLGDEEARIMVPALTQLGDEGIMIDGPVPADTMFVASVRARYDALLCAYHDQALAPFKALHFEDGVNVTLGLPIVRTSPDHGTAFDMAGQDRAHPGPMIAAIAMAGAMAARRMAAAGG